MVKPALTLLQKTQGPDRRTFCQRPVFHQPLSCRDIWPMFSSLHPQYRQIRPVWYQCCQRWQLGLLFLKPCLRLHTPLLKENSFKSWISSQAMSNNALNGKIMKKVIFTIPINNAPDINIPDILFGNSLDEIEQTAMQM